MIQEENIKKFRIGQWSAKQTGVISVVTNVIYPEETGDMYEVHYGASFCSPTEKQYNKKIGYALAEARLRDEIAPLYTGVFSVKELTHDEVMLRVMMSLALDPHVPNWATLTIREAICDGIVWIELKQ